LPFSGLSKFGGKTVIFFRVLFLLGTYFAMGATKNFTFLRRYISPANGIMDLLGASCFVNKSLAELLIARLHTQSS